MRLTIDPVALPNLVHAIAASRTYWRTLGLLVPEADPRAWLSEPTEVDDHFVEGTIRALGAHLIAVLVTDAVPVEERDGLRSSTEAVAPRATSELHVPVPNP